jgi:hypothetical protein
MHWHLATHILCEKWDHVPPTYPTLQRLYASVLGTPTSQHALACHTSLCHDCRCSSTLDVMHVIGRLPPSFHS